MAHRRWRKHRRLDAAELNITAFMNLMVILVPFLLITAVFSRVAIIELNLPKAEAATGEPPQQDLQLEITVRESIIEIGDRSTGPLRRIDAGASASGLDELSAFLVELKRSFPHRSEATLLLEPEVSYDVLVSVMDRVRVVEQFDERGHRAVKAELFPEISIGDAVLAAASSER
jgi:biopolymer transport protein ExbD